MFVMKLVENYSRLVGALAYPLPTFTAWKSVLIAQVTDTPRECGLVS
jgi:hypothetical protein